MSALFLFSISVVCVFGWNRMETSRNVLYKDHVIPISPTYRTHKMFPQDSREASENMRTYVIHFDLSKSFNMSVVSQLKNLLKVDHWEYVPTDTFIVHTTEKLLIELAEKNRQVVWFDELRPEWKSSSEFKRRVATGEYVERASSEGAKQSITPFDTVQANVHCKPKPTCHFSLVYKWNSELMNLTGYGQHVRLVPDYSIHVYTLGLHVKLFTEYLSVQPEIADISFAQLNQLFLETSNTFLQGSNAYPIWNSFTGEGEVIGVIDSGLDYRSCYFDDSQRVPKVYDWVTTSSSGRAAKETFDPSDTLPGWTDRYNPPYSHRKIIGYDAFNAGTDYAKDATDQVSGHGTHVVGCCCGRDLSNTTAGRGSAYNAKVFFSDIGAGDYDPAGRGQLLIDAPHLQMLRAYLAGARIHSNSWGNLADKFNDEQPYNDQTRKIDLFALSYPETLVLFAAGNSGTSGASTVASPGFGINVLTIGAIDARSATPDRSSFSSYGPSTKHRIKPDVMGPGSGINAAKSSGNTDASSEWLVSGVDVAFAKQPPKNGCSREVKSGTSMATPITSGIVALLRQYLKSLTPSSASQIYNFTSSSTLVNVISTPSFTGNSLKGCIVASALKTSAEIPNFQTGFGAVHADSIITPENKGLKMFIIQAALTSDNYNSFSLTVSVYIKPSSSNFKAVLTWMDFPPEADAYRPRLVNHDLDLTVYTSSRTMAYKGNGMDVYDSINNVEMVYFPSSTASVTISVRSKPLTSNYNRTYQWSASQWSYPINSLPVSLILLGPIESSTPTIVSKGSPSNCSGVGAASQSAFGCGCNSVTFPITNDYNHPLYYHEDCTLNVEIPFSPSDYLFLCPMIDNPNKKAYVDSNIGSYVENPIADLPDCGPSSCVLYTVATKKSTCICLGDNFRGKSVKASNGACTCTGSVYDIADNNRCLYSSKDCLKGNIVNGKCQCNAGYTGTTCDRCAAGLGGTNCNCVVTNGLECGGRGKCTVDGCVCDSSISTGFYKAITQTVTTTSGNVIASNCACKDGFLGKYCMCSADCGGHGTCIPDDTQKKETCQCLDNDANINDGHWRVSSDTSGGYKCTECADGWGPRTDTSLCRVNLAACSGKHTPMDFGCLCAFNTGDGFWMPSRLFTNRTRTDSTTLQLGNTVRYIAQNAAFGSECSKCYQDDVDKFITDPSNNCRIPVPASKATQCGKGSWNPTKGRCDCSSDSTVGFWRTLYDATGANYSSSQHPWGVVNHYSCVTCTSNYLPNKDASGVQTNCKCILTTTGRCGKGTCVETPTEQGCRCYNDADNGYWDVSPGFSSQTSIPGVFECKECSSGAGINGSCKCKDGKCGGNGVCTAQGCICNARDDRGYWASRATAGLASFYSAAALPTTKGETNPNVFGYLTNYGTLIQQTCDACAPGYSSVSSSCKNNDFLCNDLTADKVIATLGVIVDIDNTTKSNLQTQKSKFLICNVNSSDPNYPSLTPPVQSTFISGTQFYLSVSQLVTSKREFSVQATNTSDYATVKKMTLSPPLRIHATLGAAQDGGGNTVEVDTATYQLMQFDKTSNTWIQTCQDSGQDSKTEGQTYSANICSIQDKQLFAVFAKNKIKSYKLIIIIASSVGAFVIIVLLLICIIVMQKKLRNAKKEKERKELVVKFLLDNRHEHKKQLRYKLRLKQGQSFTPELAASRILKYHEVQQDKLKRFISNNKQTDAVGMTRFEFREHEWELLEAAKRVKLMFSQNPWTRDFAARPNALNELQAGVSELYNENEKLKRVLGSLKQRK